MKDNHEIRRALASEGVRAQAAAALVRLRAGAFACLALALAFALCLAAPSRAQAEVGDLVAGSFYTGVSEEGITTLEAALAAVRNADGTIVLLGPDGRPAELVDDRPFLDAPYVIFPFIPNPTTEAFIESIAEDARDIGQEDGLYASVMIAQAILESGSGSSGLSKPPYNNLFGIKGSYKGTSVNLLTSEDDGTGFKYDIVAAFRRYPSVRESLQDYADLLRRDMGSFYAPAWKENAKTYVEACNYLQGHYATDTTYSGKLQGIILAYDLEKYDKPAPIEEDEAAAEGTASAPKDKRALELLRAVSVDGNYVASEALLYFANVADANAQPEGAERDASAGAPRITRVEDRLAVPDGDEPESELVALPADVPALPAASLVAVAVGVVATLGANGKLAVLAKALKALLAGRL